MGLIDRLKHRMGGGPAALSDWRQRQYIAVDLELTGLDPFVDTILSVGWVGFTANGIDLGTAREMKVQNRAALGQSPTIHGLTRRDLDDGVPLPVALEALASVVRHTEDPVLVFHHAPLDCGFLVNAAVDEAQLKRTVTVADTLLTERHIQQAYGDAQSMPSLTLSACRHRYGLGPFPAHSALEDALATAELMLHQCHRARRGPLCEKLGYWYASRA